MFLTKHDRLGTYEVLEFLGAGAMGQVYRARDLRLQRDVAIKVLSQAQGTSRNVDRLLIEARAVARLNHPNICTLHDIGHVDGRHFLVMELLDGRTLADELAAGPLPLARALAIGVQIARALDAAHTSGVVHRDLKPANVMLTRDGAKLVDFGIAMLEQTEQVDGHTDSTQDMGLAGDMGVLGSFPYMSPEQLQGRTVDGRADIFAFGVVLYETIAGRRPFQADNRAALAAAILTSTPLPITTDPAWAPVRQLVERCLEKDRMKRWQSALDLAAALELATLQLPATSRARALSTRSLSWTGIWRSVACAALAAIGVYIVSSPLDRRGAEPDMDPPSTLVRHSSDPRAMDHYLNGRYQLAKMTPVALWRAKEHFEAAIRLDRSYARAFSGLADTYALLGSTSVMTMAESHQAGLEAAEHAMRLDRELSDAHLSLAAILADHYWDWKRAEWHYRQAIALAPDDAEALRSYSFYLGYIGRATEGVPMAEHALRLDPTSVAAQRNLGTLLNFARRFDEAVVQFERTICSDPRAEIPHVLLGFSYLGLGMPDQAVAQLERARVTGDSSPEVVALHAHALARAGRRRDAITTLEELIARSEPRPSSFLLATIYVGLGEFDRAFEYLDRAVIERSWQLPMLKADHTFDRIRSHPRFPEILARLNLPH